MLMTVIWILVFIISLIILLKSSEYFTRAAEKIGLILGVPAFIIGATIVSVGTTLPELSTSVFAVLRGSSEIVVGNVVGSCIANILLIIGIVAIFARKFDVKYNLIKIDIPFMILSAFFVLFTCLDGVFTFREGLFGLAGIVIYFGFVIITSKHSIAVKKPINKKETDSRTSNLSKQLLLLVVSGVFLFLGAKYTIESVVSLSHFLSISEDIIAISAVALGTSLPELFVGIASVRRGKIEIALGNVLGANILDSFFVMGASAMFGSLIIPLDVILFSIPVMLGVTFLYFFAIRDGKMHRWTGVIFVLAYLLYLGKVFGLF